MGMDVSPKLNPLRKFPICSKNLKISPAFGSWKTAKIHCNGKEDWKITVRTNLLNPKQDTVSINENTSFSDLNQSKKQLVKVVMLYSIAAHQRKS